MNRVLPFVPNDWQVKVRRKWAMSASRHEPEARKQYDSFESGVKTEPERANGSLSGARDIHSVCIRPVDHQLSVEMV